MKWEELDFRQIQDELLLFWLLDDFEITDEMAVRIPAVPSKRTN